MKIFCVILLCFSIFVFAEDQVMLQAEKLYRKGETVEDPMMKQNTFNEALALYGELIDKGNVGNGKLYYNFANVFYKLGEYPYALFFYNKALRLRPNDKNVLYNLQATRKQMGIENEQKKSFFFSPLLLQLFALFCFLFFLFWSLYVWFPISFYKYASFFCLLFTILFMFSILHIRYFSPIEGIVIHATALFKGPGEKFGKVSDEILYSGRSVQVLAIEEHGKWLKILSDSETLGFIPSISIKFL